MTKFGNFLFRHLVTLTAESTMTNKLIIFIRFFSRPRVDRICMVHLLIAVVIVLEEAITDVVFVNDVTG